MNDQEAEAAPGSYEEHGQWDSDEIYTIQQI